MLALIPDPRRRQGKQYGLEFILASCIVATLAGAKSYREIGSHTADMSQNLLKKLGARWSFFSHRYIHPSRSTIRFLLTRIDAAALDEITCAWIFSRARRSNDADELVIAIDGKVLRGSWTNENDKVTLFSAMLHGEAVTVAQVRVPDGTNEITQVEAILEATEIPKGKPVLFTMDAAHTQRETAETIGGKPGIGYVMTVKGNQENLRRTLIDKLLYLTCETPHDVVSEYSGGRTKKWSCWITDAKEVDFPHARKAALIRREVFEASGCRVSKEIALILTGGEPGEMVAAEVNRHVRNHWGIENKVHYIRDTVYREDDNQAWSGKGPQALASLRNFAIGLIRLKGGNAIRETTQWISRNQSRALNYMTT